MANILNAISNYVKCFNKNLAVCNAWWHFIKLKQNQHLDDDSAPLKQSVMNHSYIYTDVLYFI